MKKLLLLIIAISPLFNNAQAKKLTLTEAIKIAQKKSPDYKINLNRNQSNYWRFKRYKASFLPELRLNATLPEYRNAVRRITNDAGQDIFVTQNQLLIEGGLSISQSVPFTGGTLSVNTNLERVELFGIDDNIGYSVIPFSINYFQNSILFNEFKWDKKIEPLKYQESQREYFESLEEISVNTTRRFFDLMLAQINLEIAQKNVANNANTKMRQSENP